MKDTTPSMFQRGKTETHVIPAVDKDGALEVATGMGSVRIGYVKADDTLLMPTMGGSMEYRRVK